MGRKVQTVADFIFLGSKITEDSNCSHEIKRHLLLGKKAMTNLDSILKSRDITFPIMVHIVKAMVFPVVMYGCESWTRKMAEHWRIYGFEMWCWRRLLRVPWTTRRSNQSILKATQSCWYSSTCPFFFFLVVLFPRNTPSVAYENKPWIFIGRTDVEAEAPIIWPCNAKSWLIGKDWCWERLKAGGEGDDQGWDGWMTSPTQWTHIWTNSRKWITG